MPDSSLIKVMTFKALFYLLILLDFIIREVLSLQKNSAASMKSSHIPSASSPTMVFPIINLLH